MPLRFKASSIFPWIICCEPGAGERFRRRRAAESISGFADAGGVERARLFRAEDGCTPWRLRINAARNMGTFVAEVMNVVGDVNGNTCLIIDDIVDTAGTLVKTVDALTDAGTTRLYALRQPRRAFGSGRFIGIANWRLEQLVVTDTIPFAKKRQKLPKIKVLAICGASGRGD